MHAMLFTNATLPVACAEKFTKRSAPNLLQMLEADPEAAAPRRGGARPMKDPRMRRQVGERPFIACENPEPAFVPVREGVTHLA